MSTLEARLDELEGKDKSEVEKLTAKLAEYDRKAQEAEQRALRAEVAASKGLTPAQAKRLQGGSLEELEADADELLESFKPQEGNCSSGPLPGKPTEQLRGWQRPDHRTRGAGPGQVGRPGAPRVLTPNLRTAPPMAADRGNPLDHRRSTSWRTPSSSPR